MLAPVSMPLSASPPLSLRAYLESILLHGVGTAVFCLGVALALAVSTGRAFDVQLAYSLGTGMPCWLLIESGRYALRQPGDYNWPSGWRGSVLVAVSIVLSYFIGTVIGDAYCGCSTWDAYTLFPERFRSSIVITVAAGLAGSYIFYSLGKANLLKASVAQAERDAAQAQQLAAESRLKLLETQIEPHMLFNTLANLRALISTDPERALTMLDHLNNYLRATLTASRTTPGHASHTLQIEFDRLRDYLELMAVRMGPRLRYVLDLPPELAGLPLPALLLQPIVENSIKHGLEPSRQGGEIRVSAARVKQQLQLQVVDTGVGLAPGLPDPGRGFGLTQVRERLQSLHGEHFSFSMQAQLPHGLRTTLVLPAPVGV